MSTDKTGSEVFDSLIRIDEIAIARVFDKPIVQLMEADPIGGARALIFVDLRRSGLDDKTAKARAFEMPMAEVMDYFADDDTDLDPEDPDTESGKDS